MKVLWFSSHPLNDADSGASGTWQDALAAEMLMEDNPTVELGIVATANVRRFIRKDYCAVPQWLVPAGCRLGRNGFPSGRLVNQIVSACREFNPDLIHIWGTERFWGLLPARNLIQYPSLLAIQGLKHAIAPVFFGGLNFREQVGCIGIKELIKRRSMWSERNDFVKWGRFETEMIGKHRFIGIQSSWAEACVRAINGDARLFRVGHALRRPFRADKTWQPHDGNQSIFFSTAYHSPFKGIHVAVNALSILKRHFPSLKLRIAGAKPAQGIRRDGYMDWVLRQVRRLKLEPQVIWLGQLSATEMADELRRCSAAVVPSYIESYCLALAEAMAMGVPAAVAFTGGTSFLAENEKTALFFPPGDAAMCAHQLNRLLSDRGLAQRISANAREVAGARHDSRRLLSQQLETYHEMMETV